MEINFLADIHPRVVHFPIALLATYSILEIVGVLFKKEFISKSALLILCIGVVTSLLAVLTGNQAASDFTFWTEESSTVLNDHQTFATFLLWFSAIVCGLRIYFTVKKKFSGKIKYIFLILSLVILYLIYLTGSYGGDLVKRFGIGTEMYQNIESE
jgi:uncharacterized membrane protein